MKWTLARFRREQLQRLADLFSPMVAFFLRGNRYYDPIDNRGYRKLLPYGYLVSRPNALAPGSMSLERHRLLFLFFKEHTNLFQVPLKVLHVSPERCLKKVMEKYRNIDYYTADLNSPWAEYHFDAHAIPFRDETFDVVIANHLLEHVQDDVRVMQEFYRVMKANGWGIFQVPMDESKAHTTEDPFLTDEKLREAFFGQKDHVRLYGSDYMQRLQAVGFNVEVLRMRALNPQQDFKRYAINPNEPIIYCKKTMG